MATDALSGEISIEVEFLEIRKAGRAHMIRTAPIGFKMLVSGPALTKYENGSPTRKAQRK
jgi:hypothetical protein